MSQYLLSFGYPWIVCTNVPLPCVRYPEKENLGVSCCYDFWKFWKIEKYRQLHWGELQVHSLIFWYKYLDEFSLVLLHMNGNFYPNLKLIGIAALYSNMFTDGKIKKSSHEVSSSVFLSLKNQSSWCPLGHCWSSRKPPQDFVFCWSSKLLLHQIFSLGFRVSLES